MAASCSSIPTARGGGDDCAQYRPLGALFACKHSQQTASQGSTIYLNKSSGTSNHVFVFMPKILKYEQRILENLESKCIYSKGI